MPQSRDEMVCRHRRSMLLVAVAISLLNAGVSAGEPQRIELVGVQRIWDKAPHNAFTDLIRYNDQWFCVFREGTAHSSPDGKLRVITSVDGEQWDSAALIASENADLRDAKMTVTPDGRLMLSGAEVTNHPATRQLHSLVWFSDDGRTWSAGHTVGDPDCWLWRITWHQGVAYGFGYGTGKDLRELRLFRSADGTTFDTLVDDVHVEGTEPSETAMLFLPDETCYCLLRNDGEPIPKKGYLGTARPPYTEWTWKKLSARAGGPNLIRLPDGRLLAAVRWYNPPRTTVLAWLDPDAGTLTEALRLPSGGDTSYPGLVWHDNLLWVSYYSSHEVKTSIYLAKVRIASQIGE